jgi:hypothetical protein
MTDRQKLDIAEKRLAIFEKAGWTCEVCDKPLQSGQPQLAHRISQSVVNRRKYGDEVIHHAFNLAPVCSLKCNSAVLIDHKTEAREALIDQILDSIDSERK